MKKSIVSLFTRFPVFTGNRPEVWDAARRSEDAAGQTVIYGGGFALVVANGYGVLGVYATPGSLYNAIEAAWNENDLIRRGLA